MHCDRSIVRRELVAPALLLALALGGPYAGASESPPIVEYHLVHQMLEHPDAGPSPSLPLIRIHADGSVRVHRPAYMARAGDYILQLESDELSELLSSVARTGLLELDLERALGQRRLAQGDSLYHVSDVTETVIRIRLDASHPRGPDVPDGAIDVTVHWPNVYTDRKQFPELTAVASIDAAEQQLRSLLVRPDLVEVQP